MTSTANLHDMRAVIVQMPEHWVEERRMTGADRRDEVWDGVLHVPPEPTMEHQLLESRLVEVLGPIARRLGLECVSQGTVMDPGRGWKDYRKPDLAIFARDQMTKRAIEGAPEVVVEILSPNDESRDKFPFYASRGVGEIWLIDPTKRVFELYMLRGSTYVTTVEDPVRSPRMNIRFTTIAGPKLRIEWDDGSAEI
ncbi:MAG TPA: Uma2 family endonuclease [Kofleriaceae bacterium]|jgi:Uma2 family endonuclease|nr:Uma2 family endonuclease [Kofleriaceae bacterium]